MLALTPLFILVLFTTPSLDDLCYGGWMKERGLWTAQAHTYHHQTGRYVATFLLMIAHVTPLPLVTYKAMVAAGLASFVAALYALFSSLNLVARGQLGRSDRLWLALAAVTVSAALANAPNELFTWGPGVFSYQLGLTLLLAMASAALRLLYADDRGLALGVLLTGAGLAAGVNELFAPIAVGLCSLGLAAALGLKRARAAFALALAISLLAAAVSILAPGNFARIDWEGAQGQQNAVRAIAVAAGWSGLQGVRWLASLGPWALAVAGLFLVGARSPPAWLFARPRARIACLVALAALPFALAMAAAAPPIYALGGLPYSRIINTALVLFLTAGLLSLALARSFVAPPPSGALKRRVLAACGAACALALVGAPSFTAALGEVRALPQLTADLAARRAVLAAAPAGADLTLAPLSRPPIFVSHGEIPDDPKQWVNTCTARYYGLASVRLKPAGAP